MENSIAKMRPYLVREWSDKNTPLTPNDVSYGSNKLYWWNGMCGHEWQTSAKARAVGEKCPICAGSRIVAGVNDLETTYPGIAAEWSEKNTPLKPSMIRPATHKKVWWRCKHGHEWEASVKNRTLNNSGCPYCSHNRVLPGFNDLGSRFPDVAAEWDYEKNYPLSPDEVTAFSNQKVWWKCKRGHVWYTHISTRSDGSNCPYCSNQILLPGYNDLQTRYPMLIEEWSERNGVLLPSLVNEKSLKNVWWKCKVCEHEWKAVIKARVHGLSCPVCAERMVKTGYNDLLTTHPVIGRQWDWDKNKNLSPQMVSSKSMRPVWWKCERGHSYKEKIGERTIEHKGCSICEKEYKSLLFHLLIMYYAAENGMKVILASEEIIGIRLEAYIPELKLALDLTGDSLEEKREQEVKRYICEKQGVTYVRMNCNMDDHTLVEEVRKGFRKKHIYIYGPIAEDLRLLRKKYDHWKGGNRSENT